MSEDEYVIDNPYAPPAEEAPRQLRPDRGASLMKLGIIAAVFLGMFPIISVILGAMAWSRASHDLRLMEKGLMTMEHGARPKTKAGQILGKISVIVGPFALLSLIGYIWLTIETGRF
jgi:hypothetical protein